MLDYEDYLALSQSLDAEDRSRAAHTTALAYIGHDGPPEEKRALYEAMVSFLTDPSEQVRGALAYGLLPSPVAPRAMLLVLLRDHVRIARAVAQYAEALSESDLLLILGEGRDDLAEPIARRRVLSPRLLSTLLASGHPGAMCALASRSDIGLGGETLIALARHASSASPDLRRVLLDRSDLPVSARRLLLPEPPEPAPLPEAESMRRAAAVIDPRIPVPRSDSVALPPDVPRERIGGNHLLRLIVEGDTARFMSRLAAATGVPLSRVDTLVAGATTEVLAGLLEKAGVEPMLHTVLCHLVLHVRSIDFQTDRASRKLVVSALLNDLMAEHGRSMPSEIAMVADYLRSQERLLGRGPDSRRAA